MIFEIFFLVNEAVEQNRDVRFNLMLESKFKGECMELSDDTTNIESVNLYKDC